MVRLGGVPQDHPWRDIEDTVALISAKLTESQMAEMVEEVASALSKFNSTGSRQGFVDWNTKWSLLIEEVK